MEFIVKELPKNPVEFLGVNELDGVAVPRFKIKKNKSEVKKSARGVVKLLCVAETENLFLFLQTFSSTLHKLHNII